AEKEYGISRKEILEAINAGELQFREGSTHGNPWYRLLRIEIEAFVEKKYGKENSRRQIGFHDIIIDRVFAQIAWFEVSNE
ncbi:MAG: hypothetical protein FWG14_05915, partial [Peptococcaceae bacterium]|nr:hypothetical protein [Peptococcaceae bacterium]